jgi:hypothetical protein
MFVFYPSRMSSSNSQQNTSFVVMQQQAPLGIDPQSVFKHEGGQIDDLKEPQFPSVKEVFQPKKPQNMSQEETPGTVYTAVYSGVPVYEMMCRDVAVMRRQKDSYLNATQVLKVAKIDKGKRTKILEREINNRDHEKVQGGYGKYQGTW